MWGIRKGRGRETGGRREGGKAGEEKRGGTEGSKM